MTSPWHRVIALGTQGGDPCVNGDVLAEGVHLLWTLAPAAGFPAGGYDVLRRRHAEPEWVCTVFDETNLPPDDHTSWTWLDWQFEADPGPVGWQPSACGDEPGLLLPGHQTLTVRPTPGAAAVRASGAGEPPLIEVLGPDLQTVARATAGSRPDGQWSAELWAAEVGGVRFTTDDLRLCSLCFGLPDEWSDWRPLTLRPVLLPVVPAGTANSAGLVQPRSATVAAAESRLSPSLPAADRRRLAQAFGDAPRRAVVQALADGRGAVLPSAAGDQDSARTAPALGLGTLALLAAAALDPDLSRMLGLTWHDPVTDGRWDYQVVAHHGGAPYPSVTAGFDDLDPAALPAGVLARTGVTFASSGGLEVVTASQAWSGRRALRFAIPMMGTVAGLQLAVPAGAVTLRLDGETGAVFTARNAGTVVATGTAADGAVHFDGRPGLGIDAVTWTGEQVDLVEAELFAGAGGLGDLAAFAWNLAPGPAPPVRRLTISDLAAAAGPAELRPDGTVADEAGVVGLDWDAGQEVADIRRPVRVQVARAFRGDSPAADGPDQIVVQNPGRPAAAFGRPRQPGPGWPGPAIPHRWFQRVPAAGWYAWWVRGVDAFGRLGPWSPERTVEVAGRLAPPPPDGVSARYLDLADPYLSDEDRLLAGTARGLLVEWTWPAGRRLQAPGVSPAGEFRVYLRRGDPNLVAGTVLTVTRNGELSRLATGLTWPGAADALVGCLLRTGRASYPIVAHAAGPAAWFDVADLAGPLQRPGPGLFTVRLTPDAGPYLDLTRARMFPQRIHAEPAGDLPLLTSRVLAAVSRDDTGTVTLADPLPLEFLAAQPGLLVCRGIGYPVLGQTAGRPDVEVRAAVQADGSLALPAPDDTCTVWPSAAYRAWLPGVDLRPAPDEPLSLTLVAVSASDGDPAVADDPRWAQPGRGGLGGRPGREGPVALAAPVRVPHRTPPPPPPVDRPPDGDVPAVQADPADWYGRAHWTLTIDGPLDPGGYRVMRASVVALCALDQGLRQSQAAPYAGGPFGGPRDDAAASVAWLAEHYPDLSPGDLTADPATLADPGLVQAAWRDWAAWYYPALANRQLMELADLDTHQEAFLPAHPGTVPGPAYQDTLDGRGLGRFLYRVVPVDASGNEGDWSPAYPVVQVRDVTPPAAPVLISALGAPGTVTLTWRRGSDPDLAGYRVWRATRAGALADVRRREPYAEIVPLADGPDGLTQGWSDPGAVPLTDYFYRLAAVDLAGNVSPPTAVVRARAVDLQPPDPPDWQQAERVLVRGSDGAVLPADTVPDPAETYSPAVALAWTAGEDRVTCLVERQLAGERLYYSRSGWLAPSRGARDFAFVDTTAGPAASLAATYRIRARDAAGNEQRYQWNPVTVDPAGGTV